MSNHTNCNWCNNTCYNGHFESPDYRINFCSRKCMTEYYDRFGIPVEKKRPSGLFGILGLFVVVIVIIAIANNKSNSSSDSANDNFANTTQVVDSSAADSTLTQTPSEEGEFVHVPRYSCRQCAKQIDWYGSYYWESYLDQYGNVKNEIRFIEDYSLDGDERINTELYSDEGYFTRGIFCSEDCATTNINNWSYPEDYRQEILNNQ